MNKTGRLILTVFFMALMFIVGIGTFLNAKADIRKVVSEKAVTEIPDAIESVLQEDFKGKNKWINLNGLAQKVLLKTVIKDPGYTVYRLKNGQVMYGLDKRNMKWYAEKLSEFQSWLKKEDIDFLYVQIPFKIKDDSYMPIGTHANGNQNADQLVSMLDKNGVNYLDLREEIEKDNLDWTDQFFYTDHHWRPATGLWASGKIMKRIKEDYGFDINMDYYDKKNYNSKWYRNYMLGAVGRRTGYWYSGLDDFELLTPKFETDFDFWGKSRDGIKKAKGDYNKTMIMKENLDSRADFEVNTYATYIGKNFARNVIKNRKIKNDLKVLWYSESFSGVLIPFVSTNMEEITTIDLRRHKEKNMKKYIRDYDPDVVIVAYNPSAFSKQQFKFLGE